MEKVNKIGPGSARFFKCDVSNKKDLEKLVDFTVNEFGRVDCLINNAGWHPPPTSFIDTKIEEFESLLNLNLVSYFYLSKYILYFYTRLCIPHIIKTKGNIINISSLVGHMGQSNAVAYCTTKGGIHAMTKAMAIDLAKYEVRCNSISPGNIRTPLFVDWLNGTDDASKTLTEQNNVQHLHRLGNIEECGKLALYIASDATFTTGTDFIISGGAELGYGLKF